FCKDGSTYWSEVNLTFIRNPEGKAVGILGVSRDITERKRAEEEREKLQAQFLQAQKMESVGRLAGGIAHDFNNKLLVILGYAEMALLGTDPRTPLHRELEEILKAAQHSADLTRQLLAFASKQTVSPKVVDLNDLISGMLKMLRRLIGEDIDLAWMPGHELWKVKVDPSQIDQILANLVVNSRDAISGVGKATIETHNVVIDEAYCVDHPEFDPGEYVLLAVSDTGVGMTNEVLEHIFEPFFTTKGVGKGTGLGLATVYGIVKQNDGFIDVFSEPGQGTTFKIYLHRFEAEADETVDESEEKIIRGGTETVLLVEDEKSVLEVGRAMLEKLGYRVLAANTPEQAIGLLGSYAGRVDLLITDVVMPEMNGRELLERMRDLKPELKCLYMSGYTADTIAHHGILEQGIHFVQKPFSVKNLATKVREALGT
ncbi:MAG: response regulator, partial [Deltaproteobacteria bacterium]|nr:response regulator [Deltaproteobacteria bacterium]